MLTSLGIQAAIEQPEHLVELLGPMPTDDAGRAQWSRQAVRIEAYREQWNVGPDDSERHPSTGCSTANGPDPSKSVVMLHRRELRAGVAG